MQLIPKGFNYTDYDYITLLKKKNNKQKIYIQYKKKLFNVRVFDFIFFDNLYR